jgi:hypothetical protein
MNKAEKDQHYKEMISIIREWESSGTTQVQYFTDHGLKPSLFYYWLKRYRESSSPGGFVPVQVVRGKNTGKTSEAIIMIRYPNGTSIHLPYSTPLSTIRTLAGL